MFCSNTKAIKQLVLIFTFLFLISISTKTIFAQQQNRITLTPSIMQIDLADSPPEYQISYTNSTDSTIELNFKAEDFTELEDGWKINFLNPKDAQNYQYSLASWITFDRQSLSLGPGETQNLKVLIDSNRLSPGGHYGSILARVTIPGEDLGNVKVDTILSALLFVRNNSGTEIENASINNISYDQDWFGFPRTVSIKIQNTGNTHLTPYGRIDIYDPLGNLVAKGIVNEGSLLSLPESLRKYDIKLIPQSPFLMPGIYNAVINLHWGKEPIVLKKESAFFTLGNLMPVIAGVILIAGLVFLMIRRKRSN